MPVNPLVHSPNRRRRGESRSCSNSNTREDERDDQLRGSAGTPHAFHTPAGSAPHPPSSTGRSTRVAPEGLLRGNSGSGAAHGSQARTPRAKAASTLAAIRRPSSLTTSIGLSNADASQRVHATAVTDEHTCRRERGVLADMFFAAFDAPSCPLPDGDRCAVTGMSRGLEDGGEGGEAEAEEDSSLFPMQSGNHHEHLRNQQGQQRPPLSARFSTPVAVTLLACLFFACLVLASLLLQYSFYSGRQLEMDTVRLSVRAATVGVQMGYMRDDIEMTARDMQAALLYNLYNWSTGALPSNCSGNHTERALKSLHNALMPSPTPERLLASPGPAASRSPSPVIISGSFVFPHCGFSSVTLAPGTSAQRDVDACANASQCSNQTVDPSRAVFSTGGSIFRWKTAVGVNASGPCGGDGKPPWAIGSQDNTNAQSDQRVENHPSVKHIMNLHGNSSVSSSPKGMGTWTPVADRGILPRVKGTGSMFFVLPIPLPRATAVNAVPLSFAVVEINIKELGDALLQKIHDSPTLGALRLSIFAFDAEVAGGQWKRIYASHPQNDAAVLGPVLASLPALAAAFSAEVAAAGGTSSNMFFASRRQSANLVTECPTHASLLPVWFPASTDPHPLPWFVRVEYPCGAGRQQLRHMLGASLLAIGLMLLSALCVYCAARVLFAPLRELLHVVLSDALIGVLLPDHRPQDGPVAPPTVAAYSRVREVAAVQAGVMLVVLTWWDVVKRVLTAPPTPPASATGRRSSTPSPISQPRVDPMATMDAASDVKNETGLLKMGAVSRVGVTSRVRSARRARAPTAPPQSAKVSATSRSARAGRSIPDYSLTGFVPVSAVSPSPTGHHQPVGSALTAPPPAPVTASRTISTVLVNISGSFARVGLACTAVAQQHGGVAEALTFEHGSELVLLTFNARSHCPDHADRAFTCALRLVEVLSAASNRLDTVGKMLTSIIAGGGPGDTAPELNTPPVPAPAEVVAAATPTSSPSRRIFGAPHVSVIVDHGEALLLQLRHSAALTAADPLASAEHSVIVSRAIDYPRRIAQLVHEGLTRGAIPARVVATSAAVGAGCRYRTVVLDCVRIRGDMVQLSASTPGVAPAGGAGGPSGGVTFSTQPHTVGGGARGRVFAANNGGLLLHAVYHERRRDEFSDEGYAVNAAFQDFIDGDWQGAYQRFRRITDPVLLPHATTLAAWCAALRPQQRPTRYVRTEALPWHDVGGSSGNRGAARAHMEFGTAPPPALLEAVIGASGLTAGPRLGAGERAGEGQTHPSMCSSGAVRDADAAPAAGQYRPWEAPTPVHFGAATAWGSSNSLFRGCGPVTSVDSALVSRTTTGLFAPPVGGGTMVGEVTEGSFASRSQFAASDPPLDFAGTSATAMSAMSTSAVSACQEAGGDDANHEVMGFPSVGGAK